MENAPLVTIVIPARNASKYLLRSLKSIEMLEYPKEFLEVIVADNGSIDGTACIAKEWGASVIDAPGLKVGGVRNRGASNATGSIVAFTDSDILVDRLWIATAVECLKNDKIGAVGGGCRSPENGTWVEKAWPIRLVTASISVKYLAGSSFVLRRELFEKLGGFNENIVAAEDDDLSQRIRDLQLMLLQVPNCHVVHLGYPQTLIAVARRQVWLGSSIVLSISQMYDPMNVLTYLFLVSSISLFPASLFALKTSSILIANVLILFTIPLIAAVRKALNGSEYYSKSSHFAQLWIIFFYYFSGKCIGILSRFMRASD